MIYFTTCKPLAKPRYLRFGSEEGVQRNSSLCQPEVRLRRRVWA
jgi:hypothetical protein